MEEEQKQIGGTEHGGQKDHGEESKVPRDDGGEVGQDVENEKKITEKDQKLQKIQ